MEQTKDKNMTDELFDFRGTMGGGTDAEGGAIVNAKEVNKFNETWAFFLPYLSRNSQSVDVEKREQNLVDVEDLLTTFCADVYGYAHNKKEVFGENREYFVTLEELDRVFTKFMQSIKTQPTKDSRGKEKK